MEIIPAIDIIDGKCVRLSQGDYAQKKIYHPDPVDVAKQFEDWGLERLHLVDLDGARQNHIVNHKVLYNISVHTKMVIDFGGGLKSDKDLEIAFENGAEMITGGSIAVNQPEVFLGWLEKFGPEKIILGADHRNEKIQIQGWTDKSNLELKDFIKTYFNKGVRKVISTDILVDGMLKGPSIESYKEILSEVPELELIASGGVCRIDDVYLLEKTRVKGVIIGKAIYEGRISESDIKDFLNK